MKPLLIKEAAIAYRKQGYSYSMISQELGITKSTLSGWLKDIPFTPSEEVANRIFAARQNFILAAQRKGLERQKIREEIISKAKKEIQEVSKRDLWYLGLAIYLGEGGKKQKEVAITNADPRVIRLAIRWLTDICGVDLKDIQARANIYPNIKEKEAIAYWSKITGIPKSEFQKSVVDRRIKKSKLKYGSLPYGTLRLRARKSGDLFCKISGWTEKVLEKV